MISPFTQISHNSLGCWNNLPRKATNLFLALVYAFVLPFVCWGELATPGHPHKHVHFVFAESTPLPLTEPQLLQRVAAEGLHTSTNVQHTASHHPAVPNAPEDAKPDENSPVTGRSVPSTILASLVLLLSAQEPIVIYIGNLSSADAPSMPPLSSIDISIPTPPPRLSPA